MSKREDLIRIQRESTSQADFIRRLREAGYTSEANQQEFGAGLLSTGVGLVTGIPDLVIEGYNYATGKQVPTLRQRALGAINAPTEPSTPEGVVAYNAPEVATLLYGLGSLAKYGAKGIKQFFADKKVKKVLGTLDETDLGVLRKYALKGQGGESRELMNALEKLSYSDKYGEVIAALRSGATAETIKGMAPSASKLSNVQAKTAAAQAVSNKLSALKEAKNIAGDIEFNKAFGYAGGQSIVDTENLLNNIRKLRADFAKGSTSSSDAAVKFLDDIEARLVPSGSTPSYPSKAITETVTTMERDAVGMLRPVAVQRPNIVPGASGYTFSYGPKKLTLEEAQSMLTQFGKEASSGTGLIKDVTLSDQQRIATAVFGGLKDDLRASAKIANAAGDLNAQRGIEFMMKGRDKVSKAYEAYNDVLNQKIPTWLKDKQVSQVDFDELLSTYKSVPPEQRVAFREMVGNTDAEALKAIDNRVWDDFIRDAKVERPDGTFGIDLGAMSRNWFNLMQKGDRNAADALATSLGTNSAEFSNRMSDALKFTRSMSSSGKEVPVINSKLGGAAEALVGSSFGYQPAKAVAVVRAAVNEVGKKFTFNGMDEDFLMKVLLTPEGKDFLKTANLSKNAQKTLMDLDKVQRITKEQFVAPVVSFSAPVSRVMAPEATQTEQPQQEPQLDFSGLGGTEQTPELDFTGLTPVQPSTSVNTNPSLQLDGLLNRLQPQQ